MRFLKTPHIVALLLHTLCAQLAVSVSLSRSPDAQAQTIYYKNVPPNPAGHYDFEFQTSNGITTKAAGNEFGAVGVIQYVSLEGLPITMTYTADANGYQPTGDFVPVVPEYVLRALEYIRTHPSVDEIKSRGL